MTPGCKGCIWARRGYHHAKTCKVRKREFLLTKARSEELRAAEADAWKNLQVQQNFRVQRDPLSLHERERVQPELVDEQPQPQPDVEDSDMAAGTETPDAEATRRTRILTKRSDPAVPNEEVPKKKRIWSNHSRPLTPVVDVHRVLMLWRWIRMHQIQRRCGQVTWDGYSSQSCRRPSKKWSRNCSNLKRTKRSHKLRPRDKKSSVHGLSTNGKKVEN